jgi:hypothetical protein
MGTPDNLKSIMDELAKAGAEAKKRDERLRRDQEIELEAERAKAQADRIRDEAAFRLATGLATGGLEIASGGLRAENIKPEQDNSRKKASSESEGH